MPAIIIYFAHKVDTITNTFLAITALLRQPQVYTRWQGICIVKNGVPSLEIDLGICTKCGCLFTKSIAKIGLISF